MARLMAGYASLLLCSLGALAARPSLAIRQHVLLDEDSKTPNQPFALADNEWPELPSSNQKGKVRNCASLNSFIVSANMEFVRLTGAHLMAMMVNALQTSPLDLGDQFLAITFGTLPNQEDMDAPENWAVVRAFLEPLEIDVLVFACQECNYMGNAVQLLASENRLGTAFPKNIETWGTTVTKITQPSKMFIGVLMANDPRCVIDDDDISVVSELSYNKGAVMIYLRAGDMTIAYVGTHLGASSKEQRTENIDRIMARLAIGHGGDHLNAFGKKEHKFDHVYIFGDLNYRLKAWPAESGLHYATKDCEDCLAASTEDSENKWCHQKALVHKGKCLKKGKRCGLDSKISKGDKNECNIPQADVEPHAAWMINGHDTGGYGLQPNAMYEKLKDWDTLHATRDVWESAGYTIPGYTANVPATYKKLYKHGNVLATYKVAAKIWYDFQTAIEQGSSLDPGSPIATPAELWQKMKGAYKYVPKLKSCEFDEGCVDFGWLDRLIYRGDTKVEQYRTLKMHWDLPIGDHSPLFMLLKSTMEPMGPAVSSD